MPVKLNNLFKDKRSKAVLAVFLFYFLWRVILYFVPNSSEINLSLTNISWWGNSYQINAILGGVFGFMIARHWGGLKSLLGRAISFISLGLLLQALGQTIAIYYVYFNPEGLYPSVADIGFFGSVLAYTYGAILLAKTAGVKVSLKSYMSKAQTILIPLILLTLSYQVFLRDYRFDGSGIKILLDLGYPLGQALYVSIAILTLVVSRKILGGIMRIPLVLLFSALIFQYFSDYTFLYQSKSGSYVAGGSVDMLYLTSYFIMSLCLVKLGQALHKIRES